MPLSNPSRRVAPHRRYAKKFLTLPDELLTKISNDVAPEDLPNFRLTCKTLANISAKHFGEKRLAHRRFIFTEYSMKGLVDMTAHPVFGPCVKSIMFGTHWLTKDLHVLMDALKQRNITDNAEAMDILRMYDERRIERSNFESHRLRWLLREVIDNLVHWGTKITLGTFDDIQLGLQKKARHLRGYGTSRQTKDLPFVEMVPSPRIPLQVIRDACRFTTFRPERLVLSLRSEVIDPETENALCEFLLAANGQLQPTVDAIIIAKYTYIAILPTQGCLLLKRKETTIQDLCEPMYCEVSLDLFDPPLRNAILSAPFRHLSIKSCRIDIHELVLVLQTFADTLQVVEMTNVYLWVRDKYQAGHCVRPVLCCLRDDLQLRKLTLDNVRAMHEDYSSGILIAKDRKWGPQHKIRQILEVFNDHDIYAWDYSDSEDEIEDDGEAENDEDEGDDGAHDWSKRENILRTRAKKALAIALAEP